MPDLHVWALDSSGNRVAVVDDYSSLTAVTRHAGVGSWVLDLPRNSPARDHLLLGAAVEIDYGGDFLAGPVTKVLNAKSLESDEVTVSGADDSVWLARRLALPTPAGGPYAEEDVRTGAAETVLRAFVDYNLGPSAQAVRRLTGLALETDLGRGDTVTGRGRFQKLLELCQEVALAGGDLDFRVVRSGAGFVFRVAEPADKTAEIVFSEPLGNLDSFSYEASAPEANFVYAGDRGEGTGRDFDEGGDSASIVAYGRIETLVDVSSSTAPGALTLAIDNGLAEKAEPVQAEIIPTDIEGRSFPTDYGLSDRVTAVIDGASIELIVREVTLSATVADGVVVKPTLATPGGAHRVPLLARLRAAERRLNQLERR